MSIISKRFARVLAAGASVFAAVLPAGADNAGTSGDPPHVVFVIHEKEYQTAQTLPEFGRSEFEQRLGWKCTYLIGTRDNEIPGLEALEDADLMVLSVRRQALPAQQMKHMKRYLRSAKPMIGVRTASHAFALRKGKPPEGHALWQDFDPEVLGGNYSGHYGRDAKTYVNVPSDTPDHPILRGVPRRTMPVTAWLYKVNPLADSTHVLMEGRVGDDAPHPVAWTNDFRGARIFYTSMGHPDEFGQKWFRRMLVNAAYWAMEREKPTNAKSKFALDEASPPEWEGE